MAAYSTLRVRCPLPNFADSATCQKYDDCGQAQAGPYTKHTWTACNTAVDSCLCNSDAYGKNRGMQPFSIFNRAFPVQYGLGVSIVRSRRMVSTHHVKNNNRCISLPVQRNASLPTRAQHLTVGDLTKWQRLFVPLAMPPPEFRHTAGSRPQQTNTSYQHPLPSAETRDRQPCPSILALARVS